MKNNTNIQSPEMDRVDTNVAEFLRGQAIHKQRHFGISGDVHEIPMVKVTEHLDLIPECILENNTITEDAKYFVLNGQKVKKNRFFQQWFGCDIPTRADGTSGRLIFTTDPAWILQASDDRVVSWSSCYRPSGDYWSSCIHTAASPEMGMLLILRDDGTIMGRRFVIGIKNPDGKITAIMLLRIYGNMPKRYIAAADKWLAENIIGDPNVNVAESQYRLDDIMNGVKIPALCSSNGWSRWQPEFDYYPEEWWMDGATRAILSGEHNEDARYYVNLPEWWDEDSYITRMACEYCGQRLHDDDVCYISDTPLCEDCRDQNYVWSEYHDDYVHRDNVVEVIDRYQGYDYIDRYSTIAQNLVEVQAFYIEEDTDTAISAAVQVVLNNGIIGAQEKQYISHEGEYKALPDEFEIFEINEDVFNWRGHSAWHYDCDKPDGIIIMFHSPHYSHDTQMRSTVLFNKIKERLSEIQEKEENDV